MSKKKILVVDDDEMIREMLKDALEAHNYQVCLAENGVDGVLTLVAERERIGFILTDIDMPRLNGVDALRIIKKIAPDIPVITFTGHTGSGEMSETVRLGAITCMSKPFKMKELLGLLDQLCDG